MSNAELRSKPGSISAEGATSADDDVVALAPNGRSSSGRRVKERRGMDSVSAVDGTGTAIPGRNR